MILEALVWSVVIGVASYRIWHLIARDTILDRPREWLATRLPDWFDDWASCGWCSGTWVAVILTVIFHRHIPYPVLVAVTAAGITGKISQHES